MEEIEPGQLWRIKEGCYIRTNGIFGPRIIYPVKDKGKINVKNFLIGGSWWKFVGVMIVILIILGLMWSYNHDMAQGLKCLKDPIGYAMGGNDNFKFNLTNVTR